MIEIDVALARGDFTLALTEQLRGRVTGVFGPSGAGKTTLLHVVAGLARADRLRLVVDGDVVEDSGGGVARPPHERRIAVVFQDGRLFPHMTVRGNLRYGRRPGSVPVDRVVDALELGAFLERRPWQLSGGERQRVALGRALLSAPRLLLLDEPLAGLDRGLRRQILPFLSRLTTTFDVPVVFVSHDLDELLSLTRDLLLLDDGRVIAHGSLADLAGRPDAVPLLHDLGLVNVFDARVARHAPEAGLTWFALDVPAGTAGQLLAAPLAGEAVGARAEILIRPEDVVVATTPLGDSSLTNAINGRVEKVTETAARTLMTVAIHAQQPLIVEVSRRAVHDLGLRPGATIWCYCKAQAVRAIISEPRV